MWVQIVIYRSSLLCLEFSISDNSDVNVQQHIRKQDITIHTCLATTVCYLLFVSCSSASTFSYSFLFLPSVLKCDQSTLFEHQNGTAKRTWKAVPLMPLTYVQMKWRAREMSSPQFKRSIDVLKSTTSSNYINFTSLAQEATKEHIHYLASSLPL